MVDDIADERGMSDRAPPHASGASIASMAFNVATVAAIPWDEVSDCPARGCLLQIAYAGGDLGAFRAADGRWWVRLGGRAESCAA